MQRIMEKWTVLKGRLGQCKSNRSTRSKRKVRIECVIWAATRCFFCYTDRVDKDILFIYVKSCNLNMQVLFYFLMSVIRELGT